MKKCYLPTLIFSLCLMAVVASCIVFASCSKSKQIAAPPKDDGSDVDAIAASTIIEDLKVMGPNPGTGVGDCDCDSTQWSAYRNLTTTDVSLTLSSFNLPAGKSRAVVLCETTFPDNSTRQFKLTFDKGCNVLKLKTCAGSATVTDQKKAVSVARSGKSMKIKPTYDQANTAKLVLNPTNCNGCKFRYKRCAGNWVWTKCAPF